MISNRSTIRFKLISISWLWLRFKEEKRMGKKENFCTVSHTDGFPTCGLVRIPLQIRESKQTLSQLPTYLRNAAHEPLSYNNCTDRNTSSWCSSLENRTAPYSHEVVQSTLWHLIVAVTFSRTPCASCRRIPGMPGHGLLVPELHKSRWMDRSRPTYWNERCGFWNMKWKRSSVERLKKKRQEDFRQKW